jgi:1-deoxy-D-xylulose-5-phosphate reductoisomerase
VAVAAFLRGELGFLDIPAVVEAALGAVEPAPASSLEAVLAADTEARRVAAATAERAGGALT